MTIYTHKIEKDKGVRDRRYSRQRTEGNCRVQWEMNTCPLHREERYTVLETAGWPTPEMIAGRGPCSSVG